MAGIRGRSGPPGNQNAFIHGSVGIAQRRADGVLNPAEQSIREEILSGLLADKGGAARISTAMRVLAGTTASDVSLLLRPITRLMSATKDDVKSVSGTPESECCCVSEPLLSRYRGLLQTCLCDRARP